jgi:predicted phosphate transport protein (TIGR00153 family)
MFAQAADNIVAAAKLLDELFSQNVNDALVEKMRDIEHQGDDVTHDIMRRLNSTFVTPFDREDIYSLASRLDDIVDAMEEAVDLVVLYKLITLPPEMADQVAVLQRMAELTAQAMPRLRTLKDLDDYWIEINRLENDADRLYRRLLAKLFDGEYDALTVLKLKDVVDALEEAADAFEHVANTVETIVLKES